MSEWLEIGKIVAAQGLQGELRVYPDSDFPERFEQPGQRWLLRPGETEPQTVELLRGRYVPGKKIYVLQLAGVETRQQAEELRGCKLMVLASDRPHLEPGEYHVLDLIGLEVFNQLTGEILGKVVDIIPAGHDLLVVSRYQSLADQPETQKNHPKRATKDKQILIPFVEAIVPIVDLPQGRIEITPPPGLLELE